MTILWPDNWISDSWLQVTVKATPAYRTDEGRRLLLWQRDRRIGKQCHRRTCQRDDQLMARQNVG